MSRKDNLRRMPKATPDNQLPVNPANLATVTICGRTFVLGMTATEITGPPAEVVDMPKPSPLRRDLQAD